MRIKNETQWDTADLRRIFAAILRRWNKTEDARHRVPSKRLKHITVVSTRWRGPSGYAYLHSGTMQLRLPKQALDIETVGFLFEHELAHCAGYDHPAMGILNSEQHCRAAGRYEILQGMTIRKKEPKAKAKADVQIVRYNRAAASLRRWEAKLRRAQNAVKKGRAKVRRYENILAADGRLAALKGATK